MLRAAGDPTRLRLLLLLREAELTVSELIEIVGQKPAARLPPSQAAGRGRSAGTLQGRKLGVLSRRRPGQGRGTGRARWRPWPIPALSRNRYRAAGACARGPRRRAAAYFKANARGMGAHPRPARAGEGCGSGDPQAADGAADRESAGCRHRHRPHAGIAGAACQARRRRGCQPGNAGHRARPAGCAKISPSAQVRLGDIYRLPFADGDAGFDAVLFHQVLHYLDDPGAAVAEAARVMAPGGRLADRRFRAA